MILKLILKHLNSEAVETSEDEGMSVFLKLHTDLAVTLGKEEKKDVSDVMGRKIGESVTKENGDFAIHCLRDFKINGTVGGVDQRDTLLYTSLSFQMKQGKEEAGYSSKEICAAVIRSIKAGSNLRNYLESRVNISETAFIQMLRSHFKEKDATSVFHEMSNCVQLASESELDFCLRVMSLRERIVMLSGEEGCPFDDALLKKRFFHTIFTGLKHNNIRMKLQLILKAGTLSDETLLSEISMAVADEYEHLSKFQSKINVNEITNSFEGHNLNLGKESVRKDNTLIEKITNLTAKIDDLSSVREEICPFAR